MEILFITVHIKPEMQEKFLEVIRHDASHSESDEPGCLRFDVLQDTEDPNQFYYYEVYKDGDARTAHRDTPHFKEYSAISGDLMDRPVVRRVVRNVHPQDAAWR